jgi:IMP dehydrogenase/GMP reductase
VNLNTYVSRGIRLKGCGIISAAMDTVTEKELALVMAKMGGVSFFICADSI